jgi:chemotaxis-related protein WspD
VVRERGLRLAFPVDEVHGTQRYDESELKPAPSTVARATASYSRAVLPWEGHAVGLLDDELLFHSLNRNLE